jgi:hypothetical protein
MTAISCEVGGASEANDEECEAGGASAEETEVLEMSGTRVDNVCLCMQMGY